MEIQEGKGKYIVIYGENRIEVLFTLISMINRYQRIDYVCINDDIYAGQKMLNIKCISLGEAIEIQQDSLFIVSCNDNNRMKGIFHNIYEYADFGKEEKISLGSVIPAIKGEYFYHIVSDASIYRLVIYGTDETARILNDKLNLIHIFVDFFIENNEERHSDSFCSRRVYSVYDLLYEQSDPIMVINTKKEFEKSTNVLKELGLKECINFRYIQQYEYNYYRWYHWLDPQLGYNIVNKKYEKYPGFYVYGDDKAGDYKIVITGGSTSDATLYPFPSWMEILYDLLKQNGYQVTIYAAGAWGYPVQTELIKFLRDILPLKPDLTIDYSGVNNLVNDDNYPYCNVYQKQFYENASARSNIRPVTYGICQKEDRFMQWLTCERIMKTVCGEFDIRFISILQPLLGAKEGKYSPKEKEIILNTISNNPQIDYMKQGKAFSDRVKDWIYKYYWLYDFTHLFDDYGDVYIDKCHVNEKGNKIIAQRVCELLRPVLSG